MTGLSRLVKINIIFMDLWGMGRWRIKVVILYNYGIEKMLEN